MRIVYTLLALLIPWCFANDVVTNGHGYFYLASLSSLFNDDHVNPLANDMAHRSDIYFQQSNDDEDDQRVLVDLSFFAGICHLQDKTNCPAKLKRSIDSQHCKLMKKQLIQHCTQSHNDRTTESCIAHYDLFGLATSKERESNLMSDESAKFMIELAKDYLEFDRFHLWKDDPSLVTPAIVHPTTPDAGEVRLPLVVQNMKMDGVRYALVFPDPTNEGDATVTGYGET